MASFSPLDNFKGRGRGMTPTGIVIDKSCRVYITQIPLERIERDGAGAMKAEFEVYGPLESYKMFTDRSGRFVGSALCTYRNPADASMAVYCMDGVEVEGSTLHVEPAKEHGVVLLSSGSANKNNDTSHGAYGIRDRSLGFLKDTRWQSARGGHAGNWLNARRGSESDGNANPNAVAEGGDASAGANAIAGAQDEEQSGAPRGGDNFGASASEDDGKWSHDKYELIAEGKDMDEVLGLRRPTRGGARGGGRGGGMGRGQAGLRYTDRVSSAFDKYIQERDATVEDRSLHPPPAYSASLTATIEATDVANAASNAEAMTEIAFGDDESTVPVTGTEFGAIAEEAKAEDAKPEEAKPEEAVAEEAKAEE